MKGYDAIIISVNNRSSNIAIFHHTCLIPPVLFVAVNKMHLDLNMAGRDTCAIYRPEIIKGVKCLDFFVQGHQNPSSWFFHCWHQT